MGAAAPGTGDGMGEDGLTLTSSFPSRLALKVVPILNRRGC